MKKTVLILVAILAALGLATVGALHYAARTVEDLVLKALGPESQVGQVKVRLTDVELLDIRVGAPKGWPAETALRAKRVVLQPKLSQLFSDRIELTDVVIEDGYISAARPKEGGGLRVMPGITQKAKQAEKGRRGADIRVVNFKNCVVEIYDAAVAVKPQRVRIEGVVGTVKDVQVPGLGARTDIDLKGVLPGPTHRGTISVRGWVEVAKKSSEIATQVRGADLLIFEPYLVQKTKAGIDQGTFDLDLKATVRNNIVNAPGTLTINSLKLKQAESPLGAIASIPRRAALGAVTDQQERITVSFTLQGDLDDPKFSLAGQGALKAGIALVRVVGLSFEGLVRALYLIINGFGGSLGAALG